MSNELQIVKHCPECDAMIDARSKCCSYCGYSFKPPVLTQEEENLTFKDVYENLNKAYFRLENFMYGNATFYEHFDFDRTFTLLFAKTRLSENNTPSNFELIDNYWSLNNQIVNDFDKGGFNNLDATENITFSSDIQALDRVNVTRLHEFLEFTTPEDLKEKRFSISNIEKDFIKLSDQEFFDSVFVSAENEESNHLEKKQRNKKGKTSLSDLTNKQFFRKIKNGNLTQLEIHSKTELLTQKFDVALLKMLYKDFDFFVFLEKDKVESSFSYEDELEAKSEYKLKGKDLPMMSTLNIYKDEEGKTIIDKNGVKVIDKEKLLFPYDFFLCYKFKNYLVSEINKRSENLPLRDYSKYNIKGPQDKYNINYNELVDKVSKSFAVSEINDILSAELYKLKKINREGYEVNKGEFYITFKSRYNWIENTILICDNEFNNTQKLSFKTAIKWCEEWKEKYLPLFDPYSPEEKQSMDEELFTPLWQQLNKDEEIQEKKLIVEKDSINLTEEPSQEIKTIVEDFIEQFFNEGLLSQADYNSSLTYFSAFFTQSPFIITKLVVVKGRVKKIFARECGKIFRELRPGKPISFEYLSFLKSAFQLFNDELIDENKFQKSSLYKYLTTKK